MYFGSVTEAPVKNTKNDIGISSKHAHEFREIKQKNCWRLFALHTTENKTTENRRATEKRKFFAFDKYRRKNFLLTHNRK